MCLCGLCQLLTPKTHTHTLPVYFCGPIAYSRGLPPFALLAGAPKAERRRRPWRSSRILSPSRCRCRCRCPSSSSRCSCRPPAAPRRRRSTRRCTRSRTSRCGCTATPSGCPPPPRTSLPSTSPPSSASTGPYVARPALQDREGSCPGRLTVLLLLAGRLFQYLMGANLNSSRIRMTTPVLTSVVPGAGPLRSSAYSVRLYLPAKFQASPPVPLPELNLHPDRWPGHCVAARSFSGRARDKNVVEEAEKLAMSLSRSPWANSTDYSSKSAYSVAQYSSPFRIIGRVNEVWFDVNCRSTSTAAGVESY